MLASSSFATCSGVNRHPSAPMFCISCSSLRAPMTRVETVGLRSSQLSAICATVLPVSCAMACSVLYCSIFCSVVGRNHWHLRLVSSRHQLSCAVRVASISLFSPLGRSFNLSLALIIFGPITPPFVDMMHQPNPQLATEGLLLFWSFGICSAVLGLSSVVTFRKMAHEAKGMGGLRFAFRAGICCPLVVWLIFMLLIFIWLAAGGGIHIWHSSSSSGIMHSFKGS